MNPVVSVIMPVFNAEKYLKKAIESILSQTFTDFEFIIINDGSSDNSEKIIKSYPDKRIRYFKNKKNQNLARCLNFAIKKAKGRYIARMDADDISYKNRFKKQYQFLQQNSQINICGTFADIINEKGQIIKNFKKPTQDNEIKLSLFFGNQLIHSSVFVRKEIFEKYQYNPNLKKGQDYELWVRLAFAKNIYFANLDENLLKYRLYYTQKRIADLKYYDKVYKLNFEKFMNNYNISYQKNDFKVYLNFLKNQASIFQIFNLAHLSKKIISSKNFTEKYKNIDTVKFFSQKLGRYNFFLEKLLYLYLNQLR
ncbi:glycosyltransferase [Candidatus Beckwithbacteria bacterium]|nr:glycosyltransferase [Candidatus Beckwithbacteria bacterium]